MLFKWAPRTLLLKSKGKPTAGCYAITASRTALQTATAKATILEFCILLYFDAIRPFVCHISQQTYFAAG